MYIETWSAENQATVSPTEEIQQALLNFKDYGSRKLFQISRDTTHLLTSVPKTGSGRIDSWALRVKFWFGRKRVSWVQRRLLCREICSQATHSSSCYTVLLMLKTLWMFFFRRSRESVTFFTHNSVICLLSFVASVLNSSPWPDKCIPQSGFSCFPLINAGNVLLLPVNRVNAGTLAVLCRWHCRFEPCMSAELF